MKTMQKPRLFNKNIRRLNISPARAFALCIIGIGAFLRFRQIKKYDLWFDELATTNFGFVEINLSADILGVSGFSLLWERLFFWSDSVFYNFLIYIYTYFFKNWESIRYFSAIAGVGAMVLFYKICTGYLKLNPRELAGAVLLMAISPFQIWYAQEARGYAFSCFLTLAWFLCYLSAVNKNRIFPWLLCIALGLLQILTTYYALFLVVLSGLFIMKKGESSASKHPIWAYYISMIFFLLSALFLAKQHYFLKQYFWLSPPGAEAVPLTFGVLVLGYSAMKNQLIIGACLFAALFVYGGIQYYRAQNRQGLLCPSFFLLPVAAVFMISIAFFPIYLDRRFIIFTPFYYLCLAKGTASIKNKIVRIIIPTVVLLLLVNSLTGYYGGFMELRKDGSDFYPGVHRKTRYGNLLREFIKELKEDDFICADNLNSFIIAHKNVKRYRQDIPADKIALIYYPQFLSSWEKKFLRLRPGENARFSEERNEPLLLFFSKWETKVKALDTLKKHKNIFLVSAPWNEAAELPKNEREVKLFLEKHGKVQFIRKIDAFSIVSFEWKGPGRD